MCRVLLFCLRGGPWQYNTVASTVTRVYCVLSPVPPLPPTTLPLTTCAHLPLPVAGRRRFDLGLHFVHHADAVPLVCLCRQLEELVMQKFQYVVACQVYGRMKKNQDPKADDIEMLLRRFPNLRVAYIDEVSYYRGLRLCVGTPGRVAAAARARPSLVPWGCCRRFWRFLKTASF